VVQFAAHGAKTGFDVAQAFVEEQPRLLPLPLHSFNTDCVVAVRSAKTIYVRFDGNDYSIPPEAVGRGTDACGLQRRGAHPRRRAGDRPSSPQLQPAADGP
jgi:hypothetical protein